MSEKEAGKGKKVLNKHIITNLWFVVKYAWQCGMTETAHFVMGMDEPNIILADTRDVVHLILKEKKMH